VRSIGFFLTGFSDFGQSYPGKKVCRLREDFIQTLFSFGIRDEFFAASAVSFKASSILNRGENMSSDGGSRSIEDPLGGPAEVLKDKLSPALEEIRRYGIGRLLEEDPDFLARLLIKLKHMDAAAFFSRVPPIADKLMDLLWEGVGARAGQSPGMKSVLEKAERDIHVNIEASDSPCQSHFVVEKGKITGGSGLLPFKEEDFRFMGPTEVLIDLLTGDLPLGFSNLRLQTAGHSGWVSRVAPVMREIGRALKGTVFGF
jgi:hypothetical protein